MTVYRETELPKGPGRGRLIVTAAVAQATRTSLQRFRGWDGAHEGLVFWCGRTIERDSYILSSVIPASKHRSQGVQAGEAAMGQAARAARAHEIGIIAQVHSHPGDDTRHSEGDDHMIFMPFEGMFSLVVADYGRGGIGPDDGAGLHQFQDARWVWVSDAAATFVLVPEVLDVRNW